MNGPRPGSTPSRRTQDGQRPGRTELAGWGELLRGAAPDAPLLGERALEKLARLISRVTRDPHAPTAVRDPARAIEEHLADSLTGLQVPDLVAAEQIADLGSGGGFPALPLGAALPSARIYAVESNGRKCRFIASAAADAGIRNVVAVCRRAEEWEEGRGANDAVTARALASLPVILEYAAPLLRLGGHMVAWRGRRDDDDERAGAEAARELGLRCVEVIHVTPFPRATDRHLHVFEKVAPTPGRFPRRAGMAVKHPLGAPA